MNIKKGDKVMIIKGKDRNKSGKVLELISKDQKVLVEGLNVFKKTLKARKEGEKGQIISLPRSMKMENVQLICSSCGKATRTGIKVKGEKKERYCKKCNAIN